MKETFREVREWLNYVRNYKENKINENITDGTIVELNKKIQKLEKDIKDREYIATEKDNLIALKEKRIEAMGNKISSCVRRLDELRSVVETQYKQVQDLENQVKEKEQARRKCAGAIGGLKAKINELTKDLERANQKINWLSNNQKAPTKEEILAYEMRMKEVEKRQKNGKSNNNI